MKALKLSTLSQNRTKNRNDLEQNSENGEQRTKPRRQSQWKIEDIETNLD